MKNNCIINNNMINIDELYKFIKNENIFYLIVDNKYKIKFILDF